MNTAETTAAAITRLHARKPSTQQRIRLVMPYVSEGSREELTHVLEDVQTLQKANRHLAIALADAHDEIARLRGQEKAA